VEKFAVAADCEARGVVIITVVGVPLIGTVMGCSAETSRSAEVEAVPDPVVIRPEMDEGDPATVSWTFCRLSPGCTPVMTLAA
jgi:hypothetical protein